MYTVYIIKSLTRGCYYTGVTADLARRLLAHNSGANRSTKNKGPWVVVYSEEYSEKTEAWNRERQIKSYKGGQAFKKLIQFGEFA